MAYNETPTHRNEIAMKTLVKFVVTSAVVYGVAKAAPAIKQEIRLERNTRKLQKLMDAKNDKSSTASTSE